MTRLTLILFVLMFGALWPRPHLTADEPDVQPLVWNAFLSNWQVLGPFPKANGNDGGLDTPFVENEAALRGGQIVFHKGKLLTWKPYKRRVIAFRAALHAGGKAGDGAVAYAWTQFSSPVAQKALLGVAYDDALVAWINGRQVARGEDNLASSLDQELCEVELKAGVNTLLLKVGNGVRLWDAAARFRPVGIDEPLLEFRCSPAGNIYRMPTVQVTLLDSQRQTIARHLCSGSRKSFPGIDGYYSLYAPTPESPPAFVRFQFKETGFRPFDEAVPWDQAKTGKVILHLAADRPVKLLVVDSVTGKPIAGAETWTGKNKAAQVTNAEGRVSLPDLNPMTGLCSVVAPGYAMRQVNLKWPRGELHRVELTPEGGEP